METYKRKLEDLGDLRRQVRLLEERNTVYMQRTCELEEELRRANAVRGHLDSYKRQVGRAKLFLGRKKMQRNVKITERRNKIKILSNSLTCNIPVR